MKKENELTASFRYQQDSKRYHRFNIDSEDGMVGNVYIPKTVDQIPDKIVLVKSKIKKAESINS